MGERPAVIIWREQLLGWSETFIAGQARAFARYHPVLVGLEAVAGGLDERATAPVERIVLGGRLAVQTYRLSRHPPHAWLERLRQLRPTLMHAHFGRDATTAKPIADALGIPLIATFHGHDVTRRPAPWTSPKLAFHQRLVARRLRRLLVSGQRCLAVSTFIADRLHQLGARPDRVTVRHIGIDLALFDHQEARDLAGRGRRILFVGRLVEKKGCGDLIDACARLAAMGTPADLLVLGDGPLRATLESQARAAGVRVEFRGACPPATVKAELARSRVLCVPSVTGSDGDAEGFGMVFIEASAMGTPVVSTRSGGIGDAVEDGRTGFLVPERDSEALAAKLSLLLEDDEAWLSMSRHGIARVRELFDIRRCTAALEQIYDSLLQGDRHA